MRNLRRLAFTLTLISPLAIGNVFAANEASHESNSQECRGLPGYSALKQALTAARQQPNGGFNLDMWGTVVNRDGLVCAVAFTGNDRGAQWPGSRVISAQKANTANAFSLPGLAAQQSSEYARGLCRSGVPVRRGE
jgi:hypothetical protein